MVRHPKGMFKSIKGNHPKPFSGNLLHGGVAPTKSVITNHDLNGVIFVDIVSSDTNHGCIEEEINRVQSDKMQKRINI